MAVDVGTVRIGVAATDPERRLAFPVETVLRGRSPAERERGLSRISEIAAERGVVAVFVGLPKSLSGAEGRSAADAREYAAAIEERVTVPVRLLDERFSTSAATVALRASGRDARAQRGVIDQAAAVVILEMALDGAHNGILGNLTDGARRESDDRPVRG